MRYKTALPIAALAAALALPAAATASQVEVPARPWSMVPVPAGEVQHTITETTFRSNVTVPGVTPWDRVEENWVSANAARSVETDAANGDLLSEYTATPTGHTGYIAKSNTLFTVENALIGSASYSWQSEGNKIRYEITRGWLRAVEPTTYLGRPAEIYTGPAENGRLRMVIDTATDYPLETAVTFSYGSQTGSQVSKVTAFEILSPAAAASDLAPQAHPGAVASSARRGRPKARPSRHGRGKPEKPTSHR